MDIISRLKIKQMAFEFTDANFETEATSGVTVVDFWAEWCGPCHIIAPHIEALSKEYTGKVKVGKLDVDHNPTVARKYGIRSIPTVIILKDGEVFDKHVGVASKAQIATKIEAAMA